MCLCKTNYRPTFPLKIWYIRILKTAKKLKMNKYCWFLISAVLFQSCNSSKYNPLTTALKSKNDAIKTVMQNPVYYKLQIIYTSIQRYPNGEVELTDYKYHVNANNYFYPASTVKFPFSILALEKLDQMPNTSVNSEFRIESQSEKLKFSEEISKIFAVSSNESSTNLYEFLGKDYINNSMKSKGLQPIRIAHRLSSPDSENPTNKTVYIYNNTKKDSIAVPAYKSSEIVPLKLKNIKKGKGYTKDDVLVVEPMDFSKKNYYPLETMHNTLKRVIFPENFKPSERFNLSKESHDFLLYSMQNLPKNAGYDQKNYPDNYCKFFMYGDTKEDIPENIKIYNKIGVAYGTVTDCAYIVDTKNNVEFMITATLLSNKNEIFNDGIYEYDTIAFPFLAQLGRELYQQNLSKSRNP